MIDRLNTLREQYGLPPYHEEPYSHDAEEYVPEEDNTNDPT